MRPAISLSLASCFALIFCCSVASSVEPKELVGKFKSHVTEPDGSKYDGTCEITHEGGRSLKFIWHYGKKTSIGLGKLDKDGKISVEYQGAVANREGRAEYDVKSADKLTGTFHRKGTKGKGTEVISREK